MPIGIADAGGSAARVVLDVSAGLPLVREPDIHPRWLASLYEAKIISAPSLAVAESANALYRYVAAKLVGASEAMANHAAFLGMYDEFVPDADLMPEALDLACRHGHPVYGALYAVLSRRQGAQLWTADKRLARLAHALSIDCRLLTSSR